jgi:hypothetical protein
MVIYEGEINNERYRVLVDLCLAHRDILPFAQEELFKRLDIQSDERMDLLNRSIASSGRCKEYAGRAESIFLREDVDPDGLMQSAAFSPRELYSHCGLKVSLASRSCLNPVTSPTLTSTISPDRFQNLRRIHLNEAQLDDALILPRLEAYHVDFPKRINMDHSADFKSANLPNLRSLTISHGAAEGTVGQLYDSTLPQLDHLNLYTLCVADFEHILPLATSLDTLEIIFKNYPEGLAKVLKLVSRVDVKDLLIYYVIHLVHCDNWETDFELIEEFKRLVEGKVGLTSVKFGFNFAYSNRAAADVCDQALARWKRIKDEFESICVKKKIEVGILTCSLSHSKDKIWTA